MSLERERKMFIYAYVQRCHSYRTCLPVMYVQREYIFLLEYCHFRCHPPPLSAVLLTSTQSHPHSILLNHTLISHHLYPKPFIQTLLSTSVLRLFIFSLHPLSFSLPVSLYPSASHHPFSLRTLIYSSIPCKVLPSPTPIPCLTYFSILSFLPCCFGLFVLIPVIFSLSCTPYYLYPSRETKHTILSYTTWL